MFLLTHLLTYNVPWAIRSVHPNQHLDLFSHFCPTEAELSRVTDFTLSDFVFLLSK